MNPVSQYLRSSVGRKQIMGLSGALLYGFLLIHLVGNLGLLSGSGYFNGYAHLMLHTLGKIVVPIEFVLLAAFLLHLGLGLRLSAENRAARPERYAVNASKAGGARQAYRGWMMLTGTWLLVFVLVHVPHFRFGLYAEQPEVIQAGPEIRDLYGEVLRSFANPWFTGFYLLSFVLLFSHLAHGVRSSLQSLGINHPRWNATLQAVSWAYAALICGGFAALAVWAHFQGRAL
jgi:succinate dehydrogenase / fumarate reductase cytochrome b subunit